MAPLSQVVFNRTPEYGSLVACNIFLKFDRWRYEWRKSAAACVASVLVPSISRTLHCGLDWASKLTLSSQWSPPMCGSSARMSRGISMIVASCWHAHHKLPYLASTCPIGVSAGSRTFRLLGFRRAALPTRHARQQLRVLQSFPRSR